jgi:ABC-2 type transport system permease protein
MTTLLAGKLTFNMLLAFAQLVLMFLWAWAVFKVDFFSHIPGFVVMGLCTAFAVSGLAFCWPAFAGRARNWDRSPHW